MKQMKNTTLGILALFIYYPIYALDKLFFFWSPKSISSFNSWVKDEYNLNLKRYSTIRVVTILVCYNIYKYFC